MALLYRFREVPFRNEFYVTISIVGTSSNVMKLDDGSGTFGGDGSVPSSNAIGVLLSP